MDEPRFDWSRTYTETRKPYEGWTIYADNIFFVGNNRDVPMISLYNPATGENRNVNVARYILDIKLGKKTSAKDDGDLVYLDGNKNNYLDPNNISIRPRAKSEMEIGSFPYNDVYINFRYGRQNGKDAISLHDLNTKEYLGYMSTERYWLSVKLGRKITKFDGKVGHLDGNIDNNDMDNLYLIESGCSMGEGIYSGCKIEKRFNSPRGRWMVYIYKRDPNTGFWSRVEGKSYARYLMEVKLGKVLPKDIEVDHINGDRSDDRMENLQLITPEENKFKSVYTGENRTSMALEVDIKCKHCGKIHRIRKYKYDAFMRGERKRSVTFCNIQCKFAYAKDHELSREEACNVEPDLVKIINVPTLTQEFIDRIPVEIRERVMRTCKKAEEHIVGFGQAYYVFPSLMLNLAHMQHIQNNSSISSPSSDETLKKEYIFNSLPVTPFDI